VGWARLDEPSPVRAQYVFVVVVVEDDDGAIAGAGVVVVVRSVVVVRVAAVGAGASCVSMQPASKAAVVKSAAPARMRKPDLVVVIA
jgi:hypothetical protein